MHDSILVFAIRENQNRIMHEFLIRDLQGILLVFPGSESGEKGGGDRL